MADGFWVSNYGDTPENRAKDTATDPTGEYQKAAAESQAKQTSTTTTTTQPKTTTTTTSGGTSSGTSSRTSSGTTSNVSAQPISNTSPPTTTSNVSAQPIADTAPPVAQTPEGYAYVDEYGFEHVVKDYETAVKYAASDVYSFTGDFSGGYARTPEGERARMGLEGSVEYGNIARDEEGNIIPSTIVEGLGGKVTSAIGADLSGIPDTQTQLEEGVVPSHTSFAIMPDGTQLDVEIRDGLSYLAGTNQRVPVGAMVSTADGFYQMTNSGGVKIDASVAQDAINQKAEKDFALQQQQFQLEQEQNLQAMQMQFNDVYSQAMADYSNQMTTMYTNYQNNMQGIIDQVMNIPAYESPYIADIQKALQNVQQEFKYDPATDTALQQAQNQAQQSALNQLASRGILGGSVVADRVAQVTSQLIPQYENLAFQRYQESVQKQFQMMSVLSDLDNRAYRTHQDQVDRAMSISNMMMDMAETEYGMFRDMIDANYNAKIEQYKAYERELQRQQDVINSAYNRLDLLGYADNEIAIALGVPPGTPSKTAREAMEKREWELYKMDRALAEEFEMEQIKFENDMAEISYREDLFRSRPRSGSGGSSLTAEEQYLKDLRTQYNIAKTESDIADLLDPPLNRDEEAQMAYEGFQMAIDEGVTSARNFLRANKTAIVESTPQGTFENFRDIYEEEFNTVYEPADRYNIFKRTVSQEVK